MLTLGIIDDNTGGMYLYQKLKQALPCNYKFMLCDAPLVGGGRQLFARAEQLTNKLLDGGCDAVVYAAVNLAFVGKVLSARGLPVFYSEMPILHAATYTVSNVLAATCEKANGTLPVSNVIRVAMPEFARLAAEGNEQQLVDYIAACTDEYTGRFDCIALGHSSMNNFKRCFKRVYPAAQVFDCADGVVRRIRKKYRKHVKDDGETTVVNDSFEDITDKYITQI